MEALNRRPVLLTAALRVLAALAVVWCVARGFSGATRRLDARPLVLAGHAWLIRQSPYSPEAYSRLWQEEFHSPRPEAFVFAYPPSTALVLAPLVLAGVPVGLTLLDALNLVSLALALGICASLGGGAVPTEWRGAARAGAVALAASCGALSGTLSIGQTSLWALAALLWLWRSGAAGEAWVPDVLAVAVVAMKPSLTLPLLCFLAVERPRTVAWAAALSLVLCATVAAATDGVQLAGEWFRAISAYAATPANGPMELASAQHLLVWTAAGLPTWPLLLFGAVAGGLVGWSARGLRETAARDEHWLAAIAIALACSLAHGYDLVLAAPVAALLLRVRRSAFPWYALGVLAVGRPAAVAHVASAIGVGGPLELERLASSLGTVLLAAGIGGHRLLRMRLLIC